MAIDFKAAYAKVTWDLTSKRFNIDSWGKKNDTGRGIEVTILVDGVIMAPNTETLRMYFKKPDGTGGYIVATLSGGRFYIENMSQVFAVVGQVYADLELKNDTEFIRSTTFIIMVYDSQESSEIVSSNTFTELQEALQNIGNVEEIYTPRLDALEAAIAVDFINLSNYIVGVEGTDDTPIIQAQAAIAIAQNKGLYLPANETAHLYTHLNLQGLANVNFAGNVILHNPSGIGITSGYTSSLHHKGHIYFNTVYKGIGAGVDLICLRIAGLINGRVKVVRCQYMQLYADRITESSPIRSLAYSSFDLGFIEKFHITSVNAGWINENSFYDLRTNWLLIDGAYSHGNNAFWKLCCEDTTSKIEIMSGNRNKFYDVRLEGYPPITFGPGTYHNIIMSNYSLVEPRWVPNLVTDNGFENLVINTAITEYSDAIEIARVDKNTLIFDSAAENSYEYEGTGVHAGLDKIQLISGEKVIDTGVFALDEIGTSGAYPYTNMKQSVRRFAAECDEALIKTWVYCYDANMVLLTGSAPYYINNYQSWTAGGSYYYKSASSKIADILFDNPAVKYARIVLYVGISGWAEMVRLVAFPFLGKGDESIPKAIQKAIRRPIVFTAAPTKGLAKLGQTVAKKAGGVFTCISKLENTLNGAVVAGATTITLATSSTGILSGDVVGILLDDRTTHWTTVNGAPAGYVITLATALPSGAASGKRVIFNRWA